MKRVAPLNLKAVLPFIYLNKDSGRDATKLLGNPWLIRRKIEWRIPLNSDSTASKLVSALSNGSLNLAYSLVTDDHGSVALSS